MRKIIRHKIFLLTVVITFVVITAAFISMMVGRNVIIDSQSNVAEKRIDKLTDELLNEYDDSMGYDVYVSSMFNEKNHSNIVCALDNNSNEILELYINYTQINLHEPIASLIPEINKIFEMDTEGFVIQYCKDNNMDHQVTSVFAMNADGLLDMIEELQEETGVQL